MTAGRYEYFNTTISGHRKVTLVCPACQQTFAVMPGKFAQAKKRSGGRPMTCSQSCRFGLERATKAAQRAEACREDFPSPNSPGARQQPQQTKPPARPLETGTHTGQGRRAGIHRRAEGQA